MSDLSVTRDHALAMAAASSTSPKDAALWLQIAGEIDGYLNRDREVVAPVDLEIDEPFDWAATP